MDILTDLFREAGLRRRLLDLRRLPTEGALRFPCDRSVGLHVVLSGTVFIHSPALDAPIRLDTGAIAVMGRGCDHIVSTRERLKSGAIASITAADSWPSGASAKSRIVSGAYQLWNTPLHPFFAEMPQWHVVRADRTARFEPLGLAVGLLAEEAGGDALGRESVVHGLFDVLFTFVVREIVAERGAQLTAGWSHAVRDAQVRAVVQRMHDDPARAWTLDSLAKAVGISRSVLAERFRAAMGDTPLAYLRTVRLQRAMQLLSETDRTLEQIASMVGYQDAFGFSKAFKRAAGVSPGEFRRRDAAERALAWRFTGDEHPSASTRERSHA